MDQNTGYGGYPPGTGEPAPPTQNSGMQPPAPEQYGAPTGPAPDGGWAAPAAPYGEQAPPPTGYPYPPAQEQGAPYTPPQAPAQPASYGAPTSPPAAPPDGGSKKGGGSKVAAIILAILLLGAITGNIFQYVSHTGTVNTLNSQLAGAQRQLEAANDDIGALEDDLNAANSERSRLSDNYDKLLVEYEELADAAHLVGTSGSNAEYFLSTIAFLNIDDFNEGDLDGTVYHTYTCSQLSTLEYVGIDEFIAILAYAEPCPKCH